MSALEFQPWPKIARLNRDILITEKIDGTNAAVVIVPASEMDHIGPAEDGRFFDDDARHLIGTYDGHAIFAQSRTRFITPGNDNFGFAKWVAENLPALVDTLGAGTHFGEWWGSGIQRGYGLPKGEKRFSLFNAGRWKPEDLADSGVPGLDVVPVLYEGMFSEDQIRHALYHLENYGSQASPGFFNPEGIIVWHTALRSSFKVTLKGDEAPKGLVAA